MSYSHRTVILRGDLLNSYNVFFMGLADSQLILNLSTVFDSGGASDGVYRHGENVVKFCNFMDFPNKDLFSKFNFAHKVPPQVPGTYVDWGLLTKQVCVSMYWT